MKKNYNNSYILPHKFALTAINDLGQKFMSIILCVLLTMYKIHNNSLRLICSNIDCHNFLKSLKTDHNKYNN